MTDFIFDLEAPGIDASGTITAVSSNPALDQYLAKSITGTVNGNPIDSLASRGYPNAIYYPANPRLGENGVGYYFDNSGLSFLSGSDVYVIRHDPENIADYLLYDNNSESYPTVTVSSAPLIGSSKNDTLTGTNGPDTLYGKAGNDHLNGMGGIDTMYGGSGNDTYLVDNSDDVVREDMVSGIDDGGIDLVKASASFTLGAFIENLKLIGTSAVDGSGNDLDNTLTGNAAANTLYGLGGADVLKGGAGNDTLVGGEGNDRLFGQAGADAMDGGNGSDTYLIDRFDTIKDTGTQAGDFDRIQTLYSYVQPENDGIEAVKVMAGAGNANLTGNSSDNALAGNEASNSLLGLGGNDTLSGGAGDDKLEGGAGVDRLIGGEGKDTFVFKSGDTGTTGGTYDTVTDFVSGTDKIDLDFVGHAGLPSSAFATATIASNKFDDFLGAATHAMADGVHKVVFVAGASDGFLFWNPAAGQHAPQAALRLNDVHTSGGFAVTDIV